MVLLALPPADHLLIERDRGQFVPSRRRRVMANVRAERLLKIPAEPSPELRIPGAAAQTRVVSLAGIRLGSWECARARLVSPAQASLPRSWPTPELRIPNAAAQTRIVSKARIRLDSRKSVRSFKGIICLDISEFESHMSSHAVGSLWRVYPVHGLCEQRRSGIEQAPRMKMLEGRKDFRTQVPRVVPQFSQRGVDPRKHARSRPMRLNIRRPFGH